jgi:hypothetical protein
VAKHRIRRIAVDGAVYRWRVRMIDPYWVSVRIWRDGERVPSADVRVRFDDPWLLYPEMLLAARHAPERFDELFVREPVRPGRVADLIRACGHHAGSCREFEIIDGEVRPVPTSA